MGAAPSEIRLSPDKETLTVSFTDKKFTFTAEFLRVMSPSAEVQGHGIGQRKIIGGKKGVTITAIKPVGNYAIQLTFTDNHNSGIYTWEFFANMGEKQFDEWTNYTTSLAEKGLSRVDQGVATCAG